MLWRWFEFFFILPFRWYVVHVHNWKEQRQCCKVCGSADGFNFHVPDRIWNQVVPPKYRSRVVCLACFDRMAKAKEVDYTTSLQELCFAGDMGSFSVTKTS